jgi:hypothetical protein
MMIRGDWHQLRDDPPSTGPLDRAVVWLTAAGSVVWAGLLAGLVWRCL